jgi:hypothetical protein
MMFFVPLFEVTRFLIMIDKNYTPPVMNAPELKKASDYALPFKKSIFQ